MGCLEQVAVYGGVGVCAVVGWVARACLKQIFTVELGITGVFPDARGGVLHADVLANMLGAFIFGLVSKTEKELKPYHPTFYAGLTTGFAGSCTTFSSWMVEAAAAVWVPAGADGGHEWAKQVCRGLLLLVGGFHCLLGSMALGKWIGQSISEHASRRQAEAAAAAAMEAEKANVETGDGAAEPAAPTSPAQGAPTAMWLHQKAVVYWTLLFAMWITILIVVIIKGVKGPEEATKSPSDGRFGSVLVVGMCFAPLGAWLRFLLSKYNPRFPTFPVFTLAANLLGTFVSAMLWIAAREVEPKLDRAILVRTDVWVAAMSGGFCGCLSTASTFANELEKLARDSTNKPHTNTLIYAGFSLLGAQLLLCIIMNVYLA